MGTEPQPHRRRTALRQGLVAQCSICTRQRSPRWRRPAGTRRDRRGAAAERIGSKFLCVSHDVVALDWKWLFIYPDQSVAAVNQLVIPAGTPVEFRLTSATMMNSFSVPQLGSQIYTMGGMTTHLSLLADEPGEYPGFSANFSGFS
jgi:heme/copper-type cytochrome/quinol oxidase subunit 2